MKREKPKREEKILKTKSNEKDEINIDAYLASRFFLCPFTKLIHLLTPAHAFPCHLEVMGRFQPPTYINTTGLTPQKHRQEDPGSSPSDSGLFGCVDENVR